MLSKLVDNLSEGLYNNNCFDCRSNLDYIKYKDKKLIFRCFNCKKKYGKNFRIHMNFVTKTLINSFCC